MPTWRSSEHGRAPSESAIRRPTTTDCVIGTCSTRLTPHGFARSYDLPFTVDCEPSRERSGKSPADAPAQSSLRPLETTRLCHLPASRSWRCVCRSCPTRPVAGLPSRLAREPVWRDRPRHLVLPRLRLPVRIQALTTHRGLSECFVIPLNLVMRIGSGGVHSPLAAPRTVPPDGRSNRVPPKARACLGLLLVHNRLV
jgi:hypothetical protein